MIKKAITVLLSLFMIFGLTACGNSAGQAGQPSAEETPVESIVKSDGPAENSTDVENTDISEAGGMTDINERGGDIENTDASEEQTEEAETTENMDVPENMDAPENVDVPEEQGIKVLVAYFSATNTTKGVAEHIADGLNADIYEIVPKDAYADADLNYNDKSSRTTIEMNDPDARPAISGSVEDMEQYDIVFIGYAGGIIGLN